ncbi:hypothetical protein QTP86_001738 [Hemibagrus guttatus]|nr:hypothetical protein QTP86_001738 [Hemibagrus guttatus]
MDIVAPAPSLVGGRRSVRVLGGGRRSALLLGGGRCLALLLGCGRHSALLLSCGRRSAPPLGCGRRVGPFGLAVGSFAPPTCLAPASHSPHVPCLDPRSPHLPCLGPCFPPFALLLLLAPPQVPRPASRSPHRLLYVPSSSTGPIAGPDFLGRARYKRHLSTTSNSQTPNSTMTKTKELSKDTRNKIVDLHQAGKTESAIDPSETDIVATEPSFVGGRRSVRVLGGGRRSALQLGGGRRLALLLGCGHHSALRLGCGRREDSFELHSVDLELEAVEKQIRDLQVKQAQLRQRKAALESPSARTRPAQVSFTPAPGYHAAWMQQQRKTRAKPRARASPPPPPPVFEISTQNRFAPLRETECDTVIIGDSIVRHVRATAAKGKVPAILKKNIGAVVLHAGTNDIRLRQTEILKKDFRSLVELVRTTSPTTRIIVSGPLPTFQRGIERGGSVRIHTPSRR